jgi:Secretion system C-terminal sorting domain
MKISSSSSVLKILFILIILLSNFISADVRYVSKTGNSQFPYISWKTASDSIQKCLDICDNGDTVYVGNGVYKETLIINKNIALIGSSMDSTVIDASQLTPLDAVYFNANFTLNNFTIIAGGTDRYTTGISTLGYNIIMKNCLVKNAYKGLLLLGSSSIVDNCLFLYSLGNLMDQCPNDTCHGVYKDNIIISKNGDGNSVLISFGGTPTIENNIIIEEGSQTSGIYISWHKGSIVKNNLVSGFRDYGINYGPVGSDTDYCFNNTVINISLFGLLAIDGSRTKFKNNIVANCGYGLNGYNPPVFSDYNLFWNISKGILYGEACLGDSNIVANPMFVNDSSRATSSMNLDYHLQAFSPAIHRGNPSILNKDGSRSDIGMYGGPLGETYTYKDLAPRPPTNLSAIVDSNKITLKWNKNTEADTAYYLVYIDTTENFIIDSTKLVSKQIDTIFVQTLPGNARHLYYKLTAVDKQGNASQPSEEIMINLTSITNSNQIIIDYKLFQNYPNPFNPTTIISYRLKEKGYVKLIIYDIKGSLVKVLVNETKESGYYETEFNPKGLASGIYLYRLEVIGKGNIPVFSDMRKMVIIK